MSYSHAQMVSQALTPKPSALLSVFGSLAILAEIRASYSKGNKAINHLLIGMCLSDIAFSCGWFMTTWPSPKDNPHLDLWGAYGNTSTCAAQAFFISLGFWGTPLYNTVISLFYLLIIEKGWSENRLLNYVKWTHGIIWGVILTRCIFYLAFELYNPYGVICYVTTDPPGCKGDECIRGNENTWKAGVFDTIFPIWPCIMLNVVFMGRVYFSVNRVVKNSMKYQHNSTILEKQRKEVGHQAMLYVISMLLCLVPDQVYALIYFTSPGFSFSNFWFETIAYIALPLQGFLNFVVFMRRQKRAQSWPGKIFYVIICCCRGQRSETSLLRASRGTSRVGLKNSLKNLRNGIQSNIASSLKRNENSVSSKPPINSTEVIATDACNKPDPMNEMMKQKQYLDTAESENNHNEESGIEKTNLETIINNWNTSDESSKQSTEVTSTTKQEDGLIDVV